MDAKFKVALQYANDLLLHRHPLAARLEITADLISDAATAQYQAVMAVAAHAVRTLRKRTAKPAVSQEVVRQFNGRDKTLRIVPASPDPPVTDAERDEMASLIQGYVYTALQANLEAHSVALHQLSPLPATGG